MKILIAEDDEVSELLFSLTVKDFSKKILNARTGNEAVEICKNNPDIDLILMDIQMPVKDGIQATKEIRSSSELGNKAQIPIIALTANALVGDRERYLAVGMTDYLSKPIDVAALFAALGRVTARG